MGRRISHSALCMASSRFVSQRNPRRRLNGRNSGLVNPRRHPQQSNPRQLRPMLSKVIKMMRRTWKKRNQLQMTLTRRLELTIRMATLKILLLQVLVMRCVAIETENVCRVQSLWWESKEGMEGNAH
mmetsp:Transcript_16185/g.54220  ORF Transcript_16185/g.54220 Transcript_16185/m.54220 type:complete len:127 (-) Transcript_16185:204-584(-)